METARKSLRVLVEKLLLRSLFDCRNHWQYMMITGSKDKWDYAPCHPWVGDCACCEFNDRTFKGLLISTTGHHIDFTQLNKCYFCPLTGYGWDITCTEDGTPYDMWVEADPEFAEDLDENGRLIIIEEEAQRLLEERKYWAGKMVSACNRAIEDLILNGITNSKTIAEIEKAFLKIKE